MPVQPTNIPKPFCYNGVNGVDYQIPPVTSPDATIVTLESGYPIAQSEPLNASGVPVDRPQTNGLLKQMSESIVFTNLGGYYTFDNSVITSLGGYDFGAVLFCASNNSYQVSLMNNNTFNFITNTSYIDDGIHWKQISVPQTSPTLKGVPKAPTASINTNNTQIATTEFVYNVTTAITSNTTHGFFASDSTYPAGTPFNWATPSGVSNIYVELSGGGGGGGRGGFGSGWCGGGGGGASGCVIRLMLRVTAGVNNIITLGLGGLGSTGSIDGSGYAGNPSTFQTLETIIGPIVVYTAGGGIGGDQGVFGSGGRGGWLNAQDGGNLQQCCGYDGQTAVNNDALANADGGRGGGNGVKVNSVTSMGRGGDGGVSFYSQGAGNTVGEGFKGGNGYIFIWY